MYTIPAPPKVDSYISGGTYRDKIEYVYKPEEKLEVQPVVIRYIDTDGNAIMEETSMIGEFNEENITSAKTIPGYTLIKIEVITNGKFTLKQQEVNYVYIKDDPSNFVGSYVDYGENTVTSITDIERQLKIVKKVIWTNMQVSVWIF